MVILKYMYWLNWLSIVQRMAYLLQFQALRTVSGKREKMRRENHCYLDEICNTVLIRGNLTGNAWQKVFCCIFTYVPISVLYPFCIRSYSFHIRSISVPYHFSIHSVLFCSYSVRFPLVSETRFPRTHLKKKKK